jgi:2-desacetyl-2-hydroxyethyl bacteriochlorophyllide A dehydrogenase
LTTSPETGRRIIFPRKGEVALQTFELNEPGAGEVRVRCHYSLMSIGTETTILHQRYDPDSHFARMFSYPQLQTGVQTIGQVEAVHGENSELSRGELVFLRRGHGSHQLVPADECTRVPAGIELKSACWCGLAKTAFRAAWAGRFSAKAHVLVIGAGPVGQMVVRWAAAKDCASITAVDVSSHRLAHASAGGASLCLQGDISESLEAIAQLDGGRGPAIVVDSTGNPSVFQPALAAAARFGKVILLGDTGFPARQCLSSQMMVKGLTVQATHDSHDLDGWDQHKVDQHFFDAVGRGQFPLDGLITREFAPDNCAQAYQLADTERDNTMGILFDWTKGI